MAEDQAPTLEEWAERAAGEVKGRPVSDLSWQTPEGIELKILYTAKDIEDGGPATTFPGFPPYVRGPRATMYAGRPWTIRQYSGFGAAEETNQRYR